MENAERQPAGDSCTRPRIGVVPRYRIHCVVDGYCEAERQIGADSLIPGNRLFEIGLRLWQPDERQCHLFLNSSAFTRSQGITSSGF